MAFLDNSGDIILDAVLTDTGRFRLAKGDGSFKIVKFALGDDEINYALYDKFNASGSAYYDLEILQTPVLEAFTNNTATMNSKLLSIPRTNLLYLPIVKINNVIRSGEPASPYGTNSNNNGYVVAATNNTWLAAGTAEVGGVTYAGTNPPGVWNGQTRPNVGGYIRLDQGIDNTALSWRFDIDQDLLETQYIVEIDSRLGNITNTDNVVQTVSFIDDDNIASYYFSTSDTSLVKNIPDIAGGLYQTGEATTSETLPNGLVIKGPQGTTLQFTIQSSTELRTSNYLFETIGSNLDTTNTTTSWGFDIGYTYKYIDTNIKVTGATTGYHVSLPVRFVKRTN